MLKEKVDFILKEAYQLCTTLSKSSDKEGILGKISLGYILEGNYDLGLERLSEISDESYKTYFAKQIIKYLISIKKGNLVDRYIDLVKDDIKKMELLLFAGDLLCKSGSLETCKRYFNKALDMLKAVYPDKLPDILETILDKPIRWGLSHEISKIIDSLYDSRNRVAAKSVLARKLSEAKKIEEAAMIASDVLEEIKGIDEFHRRDISLWNIAKTFILIGDLEKAQNAANRIRNKDLQDDILYWILMENLKNNTNFELLSNIINRINNEILRKVAYLESAIQIPMFASDEKLNNEIREIISLINTPEKIPPNMVKRILKVMLKADYMAEIDILLSKIKNPIEQAELTMDIIDEYLLKNEISPSVYFGRKIKDIEYASRAMLSIIEHLLKRNIIGEAILLTINQIPDVSIKGAAFHAIVEHYIASGNLEKALQIVNKIKHPFLKISAQLAVSEHFINKREIENANKLISDAINLAQELEEELKYELLRRIIILKLKNNLKINLDDLIAKLSSFFLKTKLAIVYIRFCKDDEKAYVIDRILEFIQQIRKEKDKAILLTETALAALGRSSEIL